MASRRLTAYDISQAGSLDTLISQTVEQVRFGNRETREFGAQVLRTLTEMKVAAPEPDDTKEKPPQSGGGLVPALSGFGEAHVAAMIQDIIGLITRAHAIKPLVAVLSEGTSNAQRDAAGALANIARGRMEHQRSIVAAGGVKLLASILRSGDAGMQEQAAAALACLLEDLETQDAVLQAGAIGPLVALLKPNARHEAQIQAATALAHLATVTCTDGLVTKRVGQVSVAKAGAIQPLMTLLAAGKAQEATSRALSSLAYENLQNQQEICRLGGIAKLCIPLSSVNTDTQVQAASAIANLAGGERNKSRQNAIAKAGGIRPILALVDSRYTDVQCMGLHALAQMVMNNRANQDAVAVLEGLPLVSTLVSAGSSPPEVHTKAARALAELVKLHHANQTAVADLGAISLLVSLIRSTSTPSVEAEVSRALGALAEGHRTNQTTIASAGAAGVLVGLLGSRSEISANLASNALAAIGLDNAESQREIAKLLVSMLTTARRQATQERAAASLWRLVRENPWDQLAIASAGGAHSLVKLLREGPPGGKSFALWSLSLCIDEQNLKAVVDAGAIEPLVEALKSEDISIAEQAAAALNKLASPETAITIVQAGAIAPLVLLLDDDKSDVVRQHSAGALSALAALPAHRIAIDRAGGISPLVSLLSDPSASVGTKQFSAAALGLLSDDVEEQKAEALELAILAEAEAQAEFERTHGLRDAAPVLENEPSFSPSQSADPLSSQSASLRRSSLRRRSKMSAADLADAAAAAGVAVAAAATGMSAMASPPSAPSEYISQESLTPGSPVSPPAMGSPQKRHTWTAVRMPRKTLIADEGAIAPLVILLTKEDDAGQEEAAGALRALAEHESIRASITDAGGIGPLVNLLGGSNPKARDNAEGALVRLSLEMRNRVLIIQQLVGMLYKEDIAAREQAAAAIANLAHESTANCTSIVEAGGIPPLLALLECDSVKAKENAASAITQLARGSRPNQDAITKAGGIPLLVAVLTTTNKGDSSQNTDRLFAVTTHAIWMMAKKNFANQVVLAEAGVIAPLVSMLGNASPELQLPAIGVIECLLQCRDIQAAIVRTGAIAPLCMLSRDGLPETQEQAAAALWSLATDPKNSTDVKNNAMANRATIAKLGGIESLVKMFVTGGSEKGQRNAAYALSSIASKHAENRSIVARRIVSQLNGKISPAVAARTLAAITRMCGCKIGGERRQVQVVSLAQAATELSADQSANQMAIGKVGGIAAIISWLDNADAEVQNEAAHALLAMVTSNIQIQAVVSKPEGLEGLISVINDGCIEAKEHAASTLWQLASSRESQQAIADANGLPALVAMLGSATSPGQSRAAELAAATMVRLAQGNPIVSHTLSKVGGILPLVKLLSTCSGAAQQAAAALAELALVARNRDSIANTGAIEPLIALLSSPTVGTPETAARALAHLARSDEEEVLENDGGSEGSEVDLDRIQGATERRKFIQLMGGVDRLIAMLDGSNLSHADRPKLTATELWQKAAQSFEETSQLRGAMPGTGVDIGIKMGMQEQAAAALAEFAHGDSDMQDAIIEAGGVPKLLLLVREGKSGSHVAQEHATRTLWHLSMDLENQKFIADSGCVPELVALVRNGSQKAQEVAAGTLANIARGSGMQETRVIETKKWKDSVGGRRPASKQTDLDSDTMKKLAALFEQNLSKESGPATSRQWILRIEPIVPGKLPPQVAVRLQEVDPDSGNLSSRTGSHESLDGNMAGLVDPLAKADPSAMDGIMAISEARGVEAIVILMSDRNATPLAKENAAAAIWHLALNPPCRDLIAHSGGIAPLVALLNDGTHQAHRHASDALARLANQGRSHQAQIAKKLVSLLMASTTRVQQRAAHALKMLAVDNPGSQTVIVNAGAISPLVHLLSATSDSDVKKEVADALQTIVAGSSAAVGDIVQLIGVGGQKAQELVAQLLLTLVKIEENAEAVAQPVVLQKVIAQLTNLSFKVQEYSAAVLSHLSCDSPETAGKILQQGAVPQLLALVGSANVDAHSHAAATLADVILLDDAHSQVVESGGIAPLVAILSSDDSVSAKAEAAGALGKLASAHDDTRAAVVKAGAIPPLVELLKDGSRLAQRKVALAISALVMGSRENQHDVAQHGGIQHLVELLTGTDDLEVQVNAADALSGVVRDNEHLQTAAAGSGAIRILIGMVESLRSEATMEAAAQALGCLAAQHPMNQIAIGAAGGVLPMIPLLAQAGPSVQLQAAKALSHITEGSLDNVKTVATLLAKLLRDSTNPEFPERAARAIAHLARGNEAIQGELAFAGGIDLLITHLKQSLLKDEPSRVSVDRASFSSSSPASAAAERLGAPYASLQLELAAAIRSMSIDHPVNQAALAHAGCIPLLIDLLKQVATPHVENVKRRSTTFFSSTPLARLAKDAMDSPASKGMRSTSMLGSPALSAMSSRSMSLIGTRPKSLANDTIRVAEITMQCEVAGALWMLAGDSKNRQLIADAGGIEILLQVISTGSSDAQETATGALCTLASSPHVCSAISDEAPIGALASVVEEGTFGAREQAAKTILKIVARDSKSHAEVAEELVAIFSRAVGDLERAVQLGYDLSSDNGARKALVEAGVIIHLVGQVEAGTEKASDFAAGALVQMAQLSTETRSAITHQLITARHNAGEPKTAQRIGRALRDLNADSEDEATSLANEEAMGMAILLFRLHNRD
jgi:vacuolar protein 8